MLMNHSDLFLFFHGCYRGQRQIHYSSDQSLKALYHTETTAIPSHILTEGLYKQGTTAENSGKLHKAIAVYLPTIKKTDGSSRM